MHDDSNIGNASVLRVKTSAELRSQRPLGCRLRGIFADALVAVENALPQLPDIAAEVLTDTDSRERLTAIIRKK